MATHDGTELPDPTSWACSVCQAVNPLGSPWCWLCESPREPVAGKGAADRVTLVPVGRATPDRPGARSPWLTPLLLAGTAAVLTGVARESRGLAILAGIVFVPALVRVGLGRSRAEAAGESYTAAQGVTSFLGSVVRTLLILLGVFGAGVLALVVALFMICSR